MTTFGTRVVNFVKKCFSFKFRSPKTNEVPQNSVKSNSESYVFVQQRRLRRALEVRKELEQEKGTFSRFKRMVLLSRRNLINMHAWQLYFSLRKQSELPEWEELGDSFLTWYNIVLLHLWLILVRLRSCDSKLNQKISNEIMNKFWSDVTLELMAITNTKDPAFVSKYKKQLFPHCLGTFLAYDEAMYGGDPILADALWRNLLNMDTKFTSFRKLEKIIEYVRREQKSLELCPEQTFLSAKFVWGSLPKFSVFNNRLHNVQQILEHTVLFNFKNKPSK